MDSSDYYSKLDSIVSDESKFTEVVWDQSKDHPIIKKERSIKYYVDTYLTDELGFDNDFRNKLVPIGSAPGKLYGICKVHKDGYPVRPVVSMIGTPEYELAKFLDSYIKPNIPSKFMLKSTSEFIDKLQDHRLNGSEHLVSFDVTSLFTNVPLHETIDIILKRVYGHDSVLQPPFEKDIFKKMLLKCSSGLFLYNDVWYEQTDGVAMGSPLGPSFANMFMADLEQKHFEDMVKPSFFPTVYYRYVDDTFCLFNTEDDATQFLELVNSLHPNLNFTVEVGSKTMPFLDVLVELKDGKFLTSLYRKETHTGVFMNFNATAPFAWKRGLIFGLLHRAKMICMSSDLFATEVDNLRCMLGYNGYPRTLFDKVLQLFNDRTIDGNETLSSVDSGESIAPTVNAYLKIPFYGNCSVRFAKKIKDLISDKFDVNVKTVYSTYKVGRKFCLKSRTPPALLSYVVYCFQCVGSTHTTYIGYTSRHMITRVDEHTLEKKGKKSHVFKHIKDCGDCKQQGVTLNDFKILKRCQDKIECRVSEALAIKRLKPSINKQLFANGSSLILNVWN